MANIVQNIPNNIIEAFSKLMLPTIVSWNRLEGAPRTHNFDKAIKAEVRDALWMMTKQWQMGEFNGEDAGSPIEAKVQVQHTEIQQYTTGNNSEVDISDSTPLEVMVEHQPLPMSKQKVKMSLDIRMNMGLYWSKLLKKYSLQQYYPSLLRNFTFTLPEKSRETDYIYAHKEELQQWKAVQGRCLDGYELYLAIKKSAVATYNLLNIGSTDFAAFDEVFKLFEAWYKKTYFQGEEGKNNAWLPDRLEYKFECKAKSRVEELNLHAQEYYSGSLDWYAFNLDIKNTNLNLNIQNKFTAESFIPTSIDVDGMPDKRWWKFENSKTNLSNIKPNTTDIAKLLLIEFGLTYANDWFIMPYELPIGSIAEVQSVVVKNNFGDIYWIKPTEAKGSTNPQWSLFRQKSPTSNNKVFLCPSALYVQESENFEKVNLLRDEVANMVWGVENTVPTTFGRGANGGEYALQKNTYHKNAVNYNPSAVPYVADVYYNVMTDVPENWIPFLPVHLKGHKRQIQLQRSSMLRIIEGDKEIPKKIKPLTSILRDGLDTEKLLPYYLHEDEVPRSGTIVTKGYGRTRWTNGEIYVWVSTKKQNGRGEGHSGLAFDEVLPSNE
jgi:hypothetical protein